MALRYSIALREARETKNWLRLIQATSLAPLVRFDDWIDEADQLIAILTAAVDSLRERRKK